MWLWLSLVLTCTVNSQFRSAANVSVAESDAIRGTCGWPAY
jgi:hypothetical protein